MFRAQVAFVSRLPKKKRKKKGGFQLRRKRVIFLTKLYGFIHFISMVLLNQMPSQSHKKACEARKNDGIFTRPDSFAFDARYKKFEV